MNLDSDAYCRVVCFLKSKGESIDKFELISPKQDFFEFGKWDYTIEKPTELELMSIDISALDKMKRKTLLKSKRITKLTMMTQEDIDIFDFDEGDFIYNLTTRFLLLFKDGKFIEV